MNKWRKILSETDLVHLNNKQRYWRMVAYLRLSETEQALNTYDKGTLSFKQDTLSQITLAEIYLKTNQELKTTETLELCYEKAQKDKQFKQWSFVANRVKRKSPKLIGILKTTEPQKAFYNFTYDDWTKCIQLKEYHGNAEAHLKLIETYLNTNFSQEQLKSHCLHALQAVSFNSIQHNTLYKMLENNIPWDFMVSTLFHYANRETTNREVLWKIWIKRCPNSAKKTLYKKMNTFLEKQPDIYLEELIKKIS